MQRSWKVKVVSGYCVVRKAIRVHMCNKLKGTYGTTPFLTICIKHLSIRYKYRLIAPGLKLIGVVYAIPTPGIKRRIRFPL